MSKLNFPEKQPTLRSGNIVLRPWTIQDTPELTTMCQDDAIAKFTTVPENYTLEMGKEFIEDAIAEYPRESLKFCIEDKAGEMVGSISLLRLDLPSKRAEVGYLVHASHRGKGVAVEAVKLITESAHEWGFTRVELMAAGENIPSQKVAEKANFIYEGTMRKHSFLKDKVHDMKMYASVV